MKSRNEKLKLKTAQYRSLAQEKKIQILANDQTIMDGSTHTKHPTRCLVCGFGADRRWQKTYHQMKAFAFCHNCIITKAKTNKKIHFSKKIGIGHVLLFGSPLKKEIFKTLPALGGTISIPAKYFGKHPKFITQRYSYTPIANLTMNGLEKRGYEFSKEVRQLVCDRNKGQTHSVVIVVRTLDMKALNSAFLTVKCTYPNCTKWFAQQLAVLKGVSKVSCGACYKLHIGKANSKDRDFYEKKFNIKFIEYLYGNRKSTFVKVGLLRIAEKEKRLKIISNWSKFSIVRLKNILRVYSVSAVASTLGNRIPRSPYENKYLWEHFYDFINDAVGGRADVYFRNKDGIARKVDCLTEGAVIEIKKTPHIFENESRRDIAAIRDYIAFAKKIMRRFHILLDITRSELDELLALKSVNVWLQSYVLTIDEWNKIGIQKSKILAWKKIKEEPWLVPLRKQRSVQSQRMIDYLALKIKTIGYRPTLEEMVDLAKTAGYYTTLIKLKLAVTGSSRAPKQKIFDSLGLAKIKEVGPGKLASRKECRFIFRAKYYTARQITELLSRDQYCYWLANQLRSARRMGKKSYRLPKTARITGRGGKVWDCVAGQIPSGPIIGGELLG